MPGAGNPQNLNQYSYVLNNPMRFSDPTGHVPDTYCDEPGNAGDGRCRGSGADGLLPAALGAVGKVDPTGGGADNPCSILWGSDCLPAHDIWREKTRWAADFLRLVGGSQGVSINDLPWSPDQRAWLAYAGYGVSTWPGVEAVVSMDSNFEKLAVLAGVGSTGTTSLFRAVSRAEIADILASGGLRPHPQGLSYEGKQFALSKSDAEMWGRTLPGARQGEEFHILEVRLPTDVARALQTRIAEGRPYKILLPEHMTEFNRTFGTRAGMYWKLDVIVR